MGVSSLDFSLLSGSSEAEIGVEIRKSDERVEGVVESGGHCVVCESVRGVKTRAVVEEGKRETDGFLKLLRNVPEISSEFGETSFCSYDPRTSPSNSASRLERTSEAEDD